MFCFWYDVVGGEMPLRDLRERKGLTIRELANEARVSVQTIVDLEHGRTAPLPRTLRRLAPVFGLTYEALYDEIKPKPRMRQRRPAQRSGGEQGTGEGT